MKIEKMEERSIQEEKSDVVMNSQKICSRCILDSSIPGIRFDDRGICNYCKIHDKLEERFPLGELGRQKLNQLIDKIKRRGKCKKYDCIVGISGGTDSTYCLYMVKKLGLRPLAVHFDNGWDSEIAINNIRNAVTKLDVDLKTIAVDWEEFKDIQISFLKASVPDVEIPTDIAIDSVLYRVAAKEGIHYIIAGHSFRTEGLQPLEWMYADGKYIKSIHKKFGKLELNNFPNLTISDLLYYIFVKRIQTVHLLNYINYNKEDARKILEKEIGWKYYGGHHYESIYTRFVASYILPKKFGIDKRKVEYSALIRSGQMTRDEALEKLKEPPISEEQAKRDKEYVLKKLELTEDEFEEIMSAEPKTFRDYPTYYPIIRALRGPIKLACKLRLLPYIFYAKYLGWNE